MKKFNLILCKVFNILTIILLFNSILLIITSIVSFLANLIKYNGNTDFIIYNNWIIDFLDSGLIGIILSIINFQILKGVFDMGQNKKKIYGHSVNYWRRLYENEFGRDTSKENDEEFLKNHKTWIKNNKDESRHYW